VLHTKAVTIRFRRAGRWHRIQVPALIADRHIAAVKAQGITEIERS
jgi:hypothetical protein